MGIRKSTESLCNYLLAFNEVFASLTINICYFFNIKLSDKDYQPGEERRDHIRRPWGSVLI